MLKAEADYDVVLLLRRSRKPSRFDTIRFHCQQCAEKYLKARLQEAGQRFPKTHDLVALLAGLAAIEPAWQTMQAELAALTDAAVEFRYPNRWSANVDAATRGGALLSLRLLRRRDVFKAPGLGAL